MMGNSTLKLIIFETFLFIIVHEISHLIAIRIKGYSVRCIYFLGLQIQFGDRIHVFFSLQSLLQICVMGDYRSCLNNNESWQSFLHNIKVILISAPVVNLVLSILTLILWFVVQKESFLLASCINLFLLGSCAFPGKAGSINDLECILYKRISIEERMFRIVAMQLDGFEQYALTKIERITTRIVRSDHIDDSEMLFLAGVLWKMYEKGQIENNYVTFLHNYHSLMAYSNKYSYVLMLCMLSLCEDDMNHVETDEIIRKNIKKIKLLQDNASGVSYLIRCWEQRTIIDRRRYRRIYRMAMNKLGILW